MKANYHDIMGLIDQNPLWFDEHGVPRYVKFHPTEAANIYAQEVVLLQVGCQGCEAVFQVAMSLDREQFIQQGKSLHERIEARELEYGDPPNTECCRAGPTMGSEPQRVLEYWWRQLGVGWSRNERFEVDIAPDWAKTP